LDARDPHAYAAVAVRSEAARIRRRADRLPWYTWAPRAVDHPELAGTVPDLASSAADPPVHFEHAAGERRWERRLQALTEELDRLEAEGLPPAQLAVVRAWRSGVPAPQAAEQAGYP